jgi:hypothetical protein
VRYGKRGDMELTETQRYIRVIWKMSTAAESTVLILLFSTVDQANYINALAVSVSPFFEPAKVTLGGLIFSAWVDIFMTLGG